MLGLWLGRRGAGLLALCASSAACAAQAAAPRRPMADSALRAKYEQSCPDCGGTDFVEDHAQGDLICTVSPPGCLPLLRALCETQKPGSLTCLGSAGRGLELRACGGGARDR